VGGHPVNSPLPRLPVNSQLPSQSFAAKVADAADDVRLANMIDNASVRPRG